MRAPEGMIERGIIQPGFLIGAEGIVKLFEDWVVVVLRKRGISVRFGGMALLGQPPWHDSAICKILRPVYFPK